MKDDEYDAKIYVTDVSIDSDFFYVYHFDDIKSGKKERRYWERLYAYSKEDLKLNKEILLEYYINNEHKYHCLDFDFSHHENIYAVAHPNHVLLFKK